MSWSSWDVEWTLVGANAPCWVPHSPAGAEPSIQHLEWIFGEARHIDEILPVILRQSELAVAGELPSDGIFNESEAFRVWYGAGLTLVEDYHYPDIPANDWAVVLDVAEFISFAQWLEHVRTAPRDRSQMPAGFELWTHATGPSARAAFAAARVEAGLPERPEHDPDLNQL